MSDAAASKVAHLIKLEDDLVKISSIRQQFEREKTSLDKSLSIASQRQVESIMNDMAKLETSGGKLNYLKSNIGKINQIYEESVMGAVQFDTIRTMTNVNQYFIHVQRLYKDISRFKAFLEPINQLIDEEHQLIREDLSYPMHNFFWIHYNLTQARNMEDYFLLLSENLSDDLKSIVSKVLFPLKNTVKKFDELLSEVIFSLTEALKENNLELVFKLIKIIEFESIEDLKCSLMNKLGFVEKKNASSIDYSSFRGRVRNYQKFFFNKLEQSILDTFQKCVEHFREEPIFVFDNLAWLEDELVFVNYSFSSCFPPQWNIGDFIQNVYYNNLHGFTVDILKGEPPAEDLLRVLVYDTHYSKFIASLHSDGRSKANKGQKELTIIGDDLKQVVLDDYLKVIITKMVEWNDNLINQELQALIERDIPPDVYTYKQVFEDEDANDEPITMEIDGDVYVLPDFKVTLTMFKEQADVAVESGYGAILVGVIENWSSCYLKRIFNYKQIVEDEFDRYMSIYNNERFLVRQSKVSRLFRRKIPPPPVDLDNTSPEELASISKPGIVEYLTALGNTYEINTDRLQDKFLPNYKSKVHPKYQGRVQEAFDATLNPSTELNAQVIRAIIDIIINDLYPALSYVFTKSWYDSGGQKSTEPSIAHKIVETLSEYMEELRSYASYDIYLCTFALLLDTFIFSYIRIGYENVLHGSGKRIEPSEVKKYKSFGEAIGRDVSIFYGGLQHLFTRKDSAYLVNSLRAIEFLGDLGTCEDPMHFIPQIWENDILPSFYFCSVDYVKGVCMCRKDLDKHKVNALVTELEKVRDNFHNSNPPPVQVIGCVSDFTYE